MFNLLVGPLTSIIGDTVKGFVATKKAKSELKLTEIQAQKSLKEQQIAGTIRASKTNSSFQLPFIWSTAEASHATLPAICCSLRLFCALISVSFRSALAFFVSTKPFTASPTIFAMGPTKKFIIFSLLP